MIGASRLLCVIRQMRNNVLFATRCKFVFFYLGSKTRNVLPSQKLRKKSKSKLACEYKPAGSGCIHRLRAASPYPKHLKKNIISNNLTPIS